MSEATPSDDTGRKAATSWWSRPTVATLRRTYLEVTEYEVERDQRLNEETRLPEDEAIHLAGIVLAEAFTPSTVSALYAALRNPPADNDKRREERLAQLADSRSSAGQSWQHLATITRGQVHRFPGGVKAADVPAGIQRVDLHLNYVMPSTAILVATFVVDDTAGDLSGVLRLDYQTEQPDAGLVVFGAFGRLRARIPWARPRLHGFGSGYTNAEAVKRRAVQAIITAKEAACMQWLDANFTGRLSRADRAHRPIMRVLLTEKTIPSDPEPKWSRAAGMSGLQTWRAKGEGAWWMGSPWAAGQNDVPYTCLWMARRSDAAEEGWAHQPNKDSTSYLMYRFIMSHAGLIAMFAVEALLSIYARRLADLRDKASGRHWFRGPVKDARALNDYLIGDGLDAITIAQDVQSLTNDRRAFAWNLQEYEDTQSRVPPDNRSVPPPGFATILRKSLRRQSQQLVTDLEGTTGNLRASAELRQAVANTVLQRWVLVLSVIAIVVAIAGR